MGLARLPGRPQGPGGDAGHGGDDQPEAEGQAGGRQRHHSACHRRHQGAPVAHRRHQHGEERQGHGKVQGPGGRHLGAEQGPHRHPGLPQPPLQQAAPQVVPGPARGLGAHAAPLGEVLQAGGKALVGGQVGQPQLPAQGQVAQVRRQGGAVHEKAQAHHQGGEQDHRHRAGDGEQLAHHQLSDAGKGQQRQADGLPRREAHAGAGHPGDQGEGHQPDQGGRQGPHAGDEGGAVERKGGQGGHGWRGQRGHCRGKPALPGAGGRRRETRPPAALEIVQPG